MIGDTLYVKLIDSRTSKAISIKVIIYPTFGAYLNPGPHWSIEIDTTRPFYKNYANILENFVNITSDFSVSYLTWMYQIFKDTHSKKSPPTNMVCFYLYRSRILFRLQQC